MNVINILLFSHLERNVCSPLMKVLGVVLDHRLSFNSHVTTVARACNYHIQTIRHIQHLLTTELALTLACSLILSRRDYLLQRCVAWSPS